MKKYLLSLAVVLMGTATFTSCDDDDPFLRPLTPVLSSKGAYVVCTGNLSGKIDGSLTHIDIATNKAANGAFRAANGRSLGDTPNDGLVYGSKVYIVVTGENTIEVTDKNLKSIRQIKTTELLGTKDGDKPRHIIAGGGAIWVTTYGGYVAAIDTATFKLRSKYKVGSYPEGLTGINNIIYVANSDYGNGNGSISIINLKDGQVGESKVEGVTNPTAVYYINDNLYVLDLGRYDEKWNQKDAGIKQLTIGMGKISLKKVVVPDATSAAYHSGAFYTVNAPYGAAAVSYSKYDVRNQKSSSLNLSVEHPASIAVDPATGHIFLTSYNTNADTKRADYKAPAYLKEYDANSTELRKYDIGVGPGAIFFNTSVSWK